MKYVIILKQRGEGCDYTIGCGINFRVIEAESLEKAEEQAKEYFLRNYAYGCEWDKNKSDIEFMTIAENPKDLPLNDWWNEILAERKRKKMAAKEAEEKAELARLLKKYGK